MYPKFQQSDYNAHLIHQREDSWNATVSRATSGTPVLGLLRKIHDAD
jgi:hypothetical protein